jgi:hypothetical protein
MHFPVPVSILNAESRSRRRDDNDKLFIKPAREDSGGGVRGGTRKKIVAAVKSGKWLPSRSTTIHRPVDIDLVSLIFSFGLLIIIPTTTMNTVLYRTTTMNSALYFLQGAE